MPFSLKAYKQINKLMIIGKVPNVDPYKELYQGLGIKLGSTEIIFSAYTNQGFVVKASTVTKETDHNMDTGSISSVLSLATAFANKVPALDYPKRFLYSGTEAMKWSIDCYLPINDIPSTDADAQAILDQNINWPIARLFGLFLPSQSPTSVSGDIIDTISSWTSGWFGEALTDLAQSGEDYIGKVYTLNVPFPYSAREKALDKNLVFKLGGMRIEEITVLGAEVRIPALTYENGLPDHVDITISFSTLRPLTTETFKGGMFKLKR